MENINFVMETTRFLENANRGTPGYQSLPSNSNLLGSLIPRPQHVYRAEIARKTLGEKVWVQI